MDLPPWFGEPGAYNQPDPLIYWVLMPPLAYLWAIYMALLFSLMINMIHKHRQDDEVT